MAIKPFPFVDDEFNVDENPNEVRPTKGNPRFPLIPPKPNVSNETYTKAGLKFAERLVEATNAGRPENEHIDIDDVPAGLVRSFEAADASTNQNVSFLSSGAVKTSSTGDGELFTVDVLLNPLAVCPDPMNGRTMIDAILQGRHLMNPTGDTENLDLPLFDIDSARQLVDATDASVAELGFAGEVKPGKDYQDLISVGLQGVHESILVVPTCYRTPDGATSWMLVALDGNRRLAMTMRALTEASGMKATELAAWRRHLFTAGGLALSELDADGVNAVRRTAQFRDKVGGAIYPASHNDADVEAYLDGPAARSISLRTIARCRSIRAQLVLGINPQTLAGTVEQEASKTAALVQRVVRRRHIEEAAQKAWSADAQNMQVAAGALRRVEDRIREGADYVPLTLDEVHSVNNTEVIAWAGAANGTSHPLRMATKVLATLACDGHDGTPVVKDEMKAFNISVYRNKGGERRASLSTERIMPMLGYTSTVTSPYKRTRSVIDRTMRSRVFTACTNHPQPETPWWSLVDLSIDELVARGEAEREAHGDGDGDDEFSAGSWGPATRALVLMAVIATAASPALADGRNSVSPFVVTLTGLGNTRGKTAAMPDALMFRLAKHPDGMEQLGEILRAATASPPEVPRNLIDPEATIDGDPSTKGLLTEVFLRSEALGWTRSDNEDGDTVEAGSGAEEDLSEYQQYQNWLASFTDLVIQASQTAEAAQSDETLKGEFMQFGFDNPELKSALDAITEIINNARFISQQTGN